jgi:hypothetical protein
MKLSHILYKSNNLSEAVNQFEEKGFKVEYGSKYNPSNALIYFSEGPYIEILEKAPISNFLMIVLRLIGKTQLVKRFKSWENAHEGYFDICLENHKNDFDEEVQILNEHKEYYFITKSKRLDTLNRLLTWKLLFPNNLNLPFFMTYFNIDPKPKNFVHPNGIKKINEVSYYIDNSLISIFKKLCNDSTIKLTNQKGEMRVSFQK